MIYYLLSDDHNRIGGVMISVLTLSGLDRSFEPRLGQTKDYKIDFNKHDINIFMMSMDIQILAQDMDKM
jgi:hypothetical protein